MAAMAPSSEAACCLVGAKTRYTGTGQLAKPMMTGDDRRTSFAFVLCPEHEILLCSAGIAALLLC